MAHTVTTMQRNEYGGPPDEGRMSISIDFGAFPTTAPFLDVDADVCSLPPRNYLFRRGE